MTFLDNRIVRIFIVSVTLVGVVGQLVFVNYLSKKFKDILGDQLRSNKDEEGMGK